MPLLAAIMAAKFAQLATAALLCGASLLCLQAWRGRSFEPWQATLLRRGAWIGLIATAAALVLQAGYLMEDVPPLADLTAFATETGFGRRALVRLALLALLALALARSAPAPWPTALLSSALVASFAWAGHGATSAGRLGALHLGADILHLLAGSTWIGALVLLCLVTFRAHRSGAAADQALSAALRAFSGAGPAMVALLTASGLANGWFLVGLPTLRTLLSAAYGQVLIAKLLLFATMLVLAAINRFWLTGRLVGADGVDAPKALAALKRSVVTETAIALLVLALVAALGNMEPLTE